jgi:hypothetical protein
MKSAPVTVTQEEQEFIEDYVLGDRIPWYWRGGMVGGPMDRDTPWLVKEYQRLLGHIPVNAPYFEHTLMHRTNDPSTDGVVNSPTYGLFHKLFIRWCKENGITVNRIYRASINLVEHHEGECSTPHTDHDYDHWNWLMYLNTVADSETVLFDADFNITHEQPAEAYTAFAFPGCIHAHRLPPPLARRLVVVFTYS